MDHLLGWTGPGSPWSARHPHMPVIDTQSDINACVDEAYFPLDGAPSVARHSPVYYKYKVPLAGKAVSRHG
jgi:hypothetical protein